MSKKSEEFIDKYVVGKDDWLLKHKEVIAKLLDEYETEQLTIPVVVGQSEQFICRDCEKTSKEYRDQLCEPCHKWHTDS
jgi:hypothetical protein